MHDGKGVEGESAGVVYAVPGVVHRDIAMHEKGEGGMKYKPCYSCGTFNPDLKKYYLPQGDKENTEIFVGHYIHCTNCGVNGNIFRRKFHAVKYWNKAFVKYGGRRSH